MELKKCIQNLYLKVQSERISMETPKIHAKHKNAKPYLKNLQATQPLSFECTKNSSS
jgi:hypothetical protein